VAACRDEEQRGHQGHGRHRGMLDYTDALFPFALLHFGHAGNWLWSFQVQFVAGAVLTCIILLALAPTGRPLSFKAKGVIGLVTVLLPLCGANSLAPALPLTAWLAYAGIASLRQGEGRGRRDGLLLLALAVVVWLTMAAYFAGYEASETHPPSASLQATLVTSLEFLSMSLGPSGASMWPGSALLVILTGVCAAGCLLRTEWRFPEERTRSTGLLAVLGGIVCVAMAVGYGRSGLGEGIGLHIRYTVLAAPLLCCCYLAAMNCVSVRLSRFFQVCLFTLACSVSWANVDKGLEFAQNVRHRVRDFERDAWEGLPSSELASRHRGLLYPREEILAERLEMLREAGWWPFGLADPDRRRNLREYYAWKYPVMEAPMASARPGTAPLKLEALNGVEILMVPPGTEIRIDVSKGQTRAAGMFGVVPEGAEGVPSPRGPQFDGVFFRALFEDEAEGTKVLFECLLDPSKRAGEANTGWVRSWEPSH